MSPPYRDTDPNLNNPRYLVESTLSGGRWQNRAVRLAWHLKDALDRIDQLEADAIPDEREVSLNCRSAGAWCDRPEEGLSDLEQLRRGIYCPEDWDEVVDEYDDEGVELPQPAEVDRRRSDAEHRPHHYRRDDLA